MGKTTRILIAIWMLALGFGFAIGFGIAPIPQAYVAAGMTPGMVLKVSTLVLIGGMAIGFVFGILNPPDRRPRRS